MNSLPQMPLDPDFLQGSRRSMVSKTQKLPTFAFEILRSCATSLRGQKLLVACSGGVDSVVLLNVLSKIASRLEIKLAVAYIHHGRAADVEVADARDRAHAFVRALAEKYEWPFYVREAPHDLTLSSEAALRKFRLTALDEIVESESPAFDRVALGHHADDLFETRLMRLIRGTGATGLKAMRLQDRKSVRPFLNHGRSEILKYAQQNRLEWIEDPTNRSESFFRNWIRHNWIPLLEAKRPGATQSFSRSLDLLSDAVASRAELVDDLDFRLVRHDFHLLSLENKREQVAKLSRVNQVRDFGQSKIIEVLKRLDRLEANRQRRASFQVGGLIWKVTPLEIEASRVALDPS